MKKVLCLILSICMIIGLSACGSSDKHSFDGGICTHCNMSCSEILGEYIMQNADSIQDNEYSVSYSKSEKQNDATVDYTLTVTYDSENKEIVISGSDNRTINGVFFVTNLAKGNSNIYEYVARFYATSSNSIDMSGTFKPSELNGLSELKYETMDESVSGLYKKVEAVFSAPTFYTCEMAKKTSELFDNYLTSIQIGLSAEAWGF